MTVSYYDYNQKIVQTPLLSSAKCLVHGCLKKPANRKKMQAQ